MTTEEHSQSETQTTIAADKLVDALQWFDDRTRKERAERIRWLSPFDASNGIVLGPTDTLSVLTEARQCFIVGHYIAAQVLALAFFEHVLMERLTALGLCKGGLMLKRAIAMGRLHKVLPDDLLTEADRLRELRNPFIHRQDEATREPEHSLGHRVMDQQLHPSKLLEGDAMAAIVLMLRVNNIWVRSGHQVTSAAQLKPAT